MKIPVIYLLCIVSILSACGGRQKPATDAYTQQKDLLLKAINVKINEQKARLGQLDTMEFRYKKQLDSTATKEIKVALQQKIMLLDSEKTDAQHRIQFFLMKQSKVQQMRGMHQMPTSKTENP